MTIRSKVITRRYDWFKGAVITESVVEDDSRPDNGISIRRFTATIHGWQNWKLYEGPIYDCEVLVKKVIRMVRKIQKLIETDDHDAFEKKGYWITPEEVKKAAFLKERAEQRKEMEQKICPQESF